jgi:YfiR/HmsC-like
VPLTESRTVSGTSQCVFSPSRSAERDGKAVVLTVILVASLLYSASPPLFAQQSIAVEYRNKANFLATFPSFIDWPDEAFSSSLSPLVLCVRGDFSFGTSLAELARSASPHGRRGEVRWAHQDLELRNCQIVFVSRSEGKRYVRLLQTLEGMGILTVGETPDFLAAGGMISFAVQGEALHFEVNLSAAENARLKISSRLLALAKRVINKTEAAKS